MTMSELNNLSFDNIGSWPKPVKVIFILLVCSAILGLGYWKDISVLQENL
jgi:type IV pilus assembly protein PilO